MKEFTDIEIIEAFKMRRSEVIGYVIKKYKPMIRLLVTRLGAGADSNEVSKDLLQEALIIITQKIDEKELLLNCSFKTFLYSICENLYKGQLKKMEPAKLYEARELEVEPFEETQNDFDHHLYSDLFWSCFEKLGMMCQTYLKLYWQDNSLREIALNLNKSYGYIRKHKSECLKHLIELVQTDPEYKKIMK